MGSVEPIGSVRGLSISQRRSRVLNGSHVCGLHDGWFSKRIRVCSRGEFVAEVQDVVSYCSIWLTKNSVGSIISSSSRCRLVCHSLFSSSGLQASSCSMWWYISSNCVMYLVYPWFMPVLFLISGIGSRLYLDSHTDKEFMKSRTLKLLVPSTIGLFFFQFIQGYVSMSRGGGIEGLAAAGVPAPLIFFGSCIFYGYTV